LNEPVDEKIIDQLDTRFYTAEVHRAAFALPAFAHKVERFIYCIKIFRFFFSLGTQQYQTIISITKISKR
jgi:hypothetical protein